MPASNLTHTLDIWSHVEPRFGGVGPSASALATAVSNQSGCFGRQIAVCDPSEVSLADGIDPRAERISSPSLRGWADVQIAKALRPAIRNSQVCHVHGLWFPHTLAARRLAAEMRKPVVSSVHGMLEKWELQNKWLKKRIYSLLLEKSSLDRSLCLRALSDREVDDYRRFGARSPIALVPNGISPIDPVDPAEIFSKFPALVSKKIVLFLGRVHYKKGVLDLLASWPAVIRRHPDAHLVIAGAEYNDTGIKARQLIADLFISQSVTLAGVLSGRLKLAALSAAKFFCLPSYSEGLSMSVLESLSIGLPTIITPECNMPLVGTAQAGVVCSNASPELAETLISCLNATENHWREMSRASRLLARSEFNWETIANRMQSVYEWLLGGNKPACVVA